MMTIVLREGNTVVAFYEEDGTFLGERERTEALYTFFEDERNGLIRLEVEDEYADFSTIDVEEYDGEYEVVKNHYTYRYGKLDYQDELLGVRKTERGALNLAFRHSDTETPVALNY